MRAVSAGLAQYTSALLHASSSAAEVPEDEEEDEEGEEEDHKLLPASKTEERLVPAP